MLEARVSELVHGDDRGSVRKITGRHSWVTIGRCDLYCLSHTEELLKLSVQDQTSLLARPEVLQHRVKEIQSVLNRYSAILAYGKGIPQTT